MRRLPMPRRNVHTAIRLTRPLRRLDSAGGGVYGSAAFERLSSDRTFEQLTVNQQSGKRATLRLEYVFSDLLIEKVR